MFQPWSWSMICSFKPLPKTTKQGWPTQPFQTTLAFNTNQTRGKSYQLRISRSIRINLNHYLKTAAASEANLTCFSYLNRFAEHLVLSILDMKFGACTGVTKATNIKAAATTPCVGRGKLHHPPVTIFEGGYHLQMWFIIVLPPLQLISLRGPSTMKTVQSPTSEQVHSYITTLF